MAQALSNNKFKNIPTLLASLFIALALFGCTQEKKIYDVFDRQTNTSRQDATNALFNKRINKSSQNSTIPTFRPIPKRSKMIAIPSFPQENTEKLISFSVTENVPLKDVLIELAKSADLDIDLDPKIYGGVIINARNRPITEILDRICEMGDLRYSLSKNRLHVERDTPFSKNYSLDFLNDGELWNTVPQNIQSLLSSGTSASSGGSISINKLANIVTVFASKKNHIKVAKYITSVKRSSSAQVIIEAKVIEVSLKNNYSTGIDWDWIKGASSLGQDASGVSAGSPISLVTGGANLLGGSISATISALEEFGVVRAISSPRINALNNQEATLNFTKKLIYFTYEVSENTTTTNGVSNSNLIIDSTVNEVLTGVELSITPVIDLVTNEITLSVSPKITSTNDNAEQDIRDPQDFTQIIINNKIPIIDTRELKTIAKIKNGNVLIIGGVMTEDTDNQDKGVPFLQQIPFLGNLFKSVSKTSTVVETAIFIKATIVNPEDSLGKYDRNLNNTFTNSAKPFINSN